MQPIVRVAMPAVEGAPEGLSVDAAAEDVYTAATEMLARCEGPEQSTMVVPHAARRAPQVARAAAGHPGLALAAVCGPLTVQAVTDHVLRSSRLTAGELVEVARGLAPFLRTYAVVSSVARVEMPAPSFWQHLASALPWTSFGIDVHAATIGKPDSLPDDEPGATVRAVTGPSARKRIHPELLPTASGAVELEVHQAPDTWGARHAVECTLLVGLVEDVVEEILSAPSRDCVNCHVPTRLPVCPFCGVRQDVPTERKVTE